MSGSQVDMAAFEEGIVGIAGEGIVDSAEEEVVDIPDMLDTVEDIAGMEIEEDIVDSHDIAVGIVA